MIGFQDLLPKLLVGAPVVEDEVDRLIFSFKVSVLSE